MVRRGKLRGLKRQALQRKEAQKKLGIGVQHASYPCELLTLQIGIRPQTRISHDLRPQDNSNTALARVNSRSSGYGSLGCMDTLQVNNHLSRSVSVNTGKLITVKAKLMLVTHVSNVILILHLVS